MKILTVSIAAYNMEVYLRETLESLVAERVIDDLEVFVIDDGSIDHTLEIAQEYAAKYPNSIFPVHKENGGYGTTVNYSIAHATGKYFKLLDGDDWFDKDGLVKFIEFLKYSDVDMIVTPFYRISGKGIVKIEPLDKIERNKMHTIAEINYVKVKQTLSMWAVAYKTEIIRDRWMDLPKKMFYTDVLYVLKGIATARSLYCLDYPLYCYREGREGSSTSGENFIEHYSDHMEVAYKSAEYYEQEKQKGNANLLMLRARAVSTCAGTAKAIMLRPVTHENLQLIRQFDRKLKQVSFDLYKESEEYGRVGLILKMMRVTGYFAYWFLWIFEIISK